MTFKQLNKEEFILEYRTSSIIKLSLKHKVKEITIRKWAEKLGVTKKKTWLKSEEAELKSLYKDYASKNCVHVLARKYGVSVDAVKTKYHNELKEHDNRD